MIDPQEEMMRDTPKKSWQPMQVRYVGDVSDLVQQVTNRRRRRRRRGGNSGLSWSS